MEYIWFPDKKSNNNKSENEKNIEKEDKKVLEKRAKINYLGKDVLDGFLLTSSKDAEVRTSTENKLKSN